MKTNSAVMGAGIAFLFILIIGYLPSLLAPIFVGTGSQIATSTNTTTNGAVTGAATIATNTQTASGSGLSIAPYIVLIGLVLGAVFGKDLSQLVGSKLKM